MRSALLVALLLAGLLALALLRSDRPHGALPEAPPPAPNAAIERDPFENSEAAIESANSVGVPLRESLATPTDACAIPPESGANAPVRIEVRYAGSGRPVRGAKVSIGPPLTECRTDEHGVVELHVPQGSKLSSVRVNACDNADPFVPYERIIEQVVLPGGNEIQVSVERGIDLRGVVRAAGTGVALPGANVSYKGFGYRTQVVSDADGAFLCEALLVNSGNPSPLNIERDGYLPSTVKPLSADIEPGAPPLLVLLETGITVSGRVVDSDHKPVAGAFLVVFTPAAFRAVSDEQGFFAIGGMKPSEQASLYAQTQSWSRPPILERSLDLGALTASRFDLEFEVQRAVEVRVFAELPDGSGLAASNFEVDWGDGHLPTAYLLERLSPFENAQVRVMPPGRDFELGVSTRAPGMVDRSAILRGSTRIHTDAQSPLELHIRLSEPGRLEIPPLPAGAGEVELGQSSELLGALDVQVLDEDSGQPIEEHNGLVFSRKFGAGEITWLSPGTGGWLRIWHNIGTSSAQVRHNQGPIERVTISIPRSGYAKAEWRLSSGL